MITFWQAVVFVYFLGAEPQVHIREFESYKECHAYATTSIKGIQEIIDDYNYVGTASADCLPIKKPKERNG